MTNQSRFASLPLRLLSPLALLVFASLRAEAQGGSDSLASSSATSGPAMVRLAPAQPRQGSVVRITVRPRVAVLAVPGTSGDSVRAHTLTSMPTAVRPGLDSLRAVLDTLAMRTDTTRAPRAPGVSGTALATTVVATDTASTAAVRADSNRARDSVRVSATLFGEPLHFTRQPSGEYVALGAIPVDAPTTTRLAIVFAHAGGAPDTVVSAFAIRRTPYKMEKIEKLTVAPRFGQAPDSALAARIAREQALAADVSRRSHATPRLWEGEFQRPRAARVTSAFGDGRQFNGKIQSRHMGLDLAGAVGAPVVATNRGVVALVGNFYYAGNAVYIDHGAGLVTAYFHLSAIDVARGDTVAPGVRIGKVGATGRVTGPHLHWVARYGAISVDPSTLLELTAADSPEPAPPREPGRTAAPPPPRSSPRDDHPLGR